MSLTVQQLTEFAHLRTRFLAGSSGGQRLVLWAHSTELPDPWNWLGTGDLLLTNGFNLPRGADAQVDLLQELNGVNLSGVVFGERPEAPPITATALAAAEEMDFPVLATEHSVPWVLLTRTVADNNSQDASNRLAKVLRQYDVLRRTYQSGSRNRLLHQLGVECDCTLHVLDTRTGVPLQPLSDPVPDPLREAVFKQLPQDSGPLPAFSRVVVGEHTSLILPVGEHDSALLVATTHRTDIDLVVLQHAATIVTMEVDRRAAMALRRRESGARLFQQLLTGTVDPEFAMDALGTFGIAQKPWRMLCWGGESDLSAEEMHMRLSALKVPSLLGSDGAEQIALVPASSVDTTFADVMKSAGARIGASRQVHSVNRLVDAAREARWALEAARTAEESLNVYGESSALFLPRSIAEGEAAVAHLLGPVIDYDRAHETQLLHSLVSYFDANRSWQDAANQLGVHRQTLIYRIRRIEEITGRRLKDLEDQTELYLAVQTWKMLQQT